MCWPQIQCCVLIGKYEDKDQSIRLIPHSHMIKQGQLLGIFSVTLHSKTSLKRCLHTLSPPPCLSFSLWPTLLLHSASPLPRRCSWQAHCDVHAARWPMIISLFPSHLTSGCLSSWLSSHCYTIILSGICSTTSSWFSSGLLGCSCPPHAVVPSGCCILGPLPLCVPTFLKWSHILMTLNTNYAKVSQMFIW